MKIQPLRHYSAAAYPTLAEVQDEPELLRRLPKRWQSPCRLAALLGFGFFAETAFSAEGGPTPADTKAPLVQTPAGPAAADKKKDAPQPVPQAAVLVAPFLAEALELDGRGSFGCVAVNPPSFLAEDEAMEIVRKELEAAGLKLQEAEELNGIEMPVQDRDLIVPPDADEAKNGDDTETDQFGRRRKKQRFAPADYAFDFADTGKSVYIEYLSGRDHLRWVGHSGSSVSYYDFPKVAQSFSGSLQKWKADKRTIFGIFFDPLPRVEFERNRPAGLTEAQSRLAQHEAARAVELERKNLQAKGQEKLRAQVRNFIESLRKQGVLEKTGA